MSDRVSNGCKLIKCTPLDLAVEDAIKWPTRHEVDLRAILRPLPR
jgi:hypothetical protein